MKGDHVKRAIFITMFVLVFLSACDPFKAEQIREQAKADQLAIQAAQAALDQEQARRQAADLHAIRMQDEQRRQGRRDAVEADIRGGLSLMLQVFFLAGTGVMVYAVLTVGRSSVIQFVRVQEGFATAMITAVDLRSRLIALDPNTRQYPLLYQYIGKGRYALTDPNKKVTILLDTRNEGDAQMIAGSIAVQHSGILVMEQRRSGAKDAASMAIVQPPVIDATPLDVKSVAQALIDGEEGWGDE
jgi:hypothetical protein